MAPKITLLSAHGVTSVKTMTGASAALSAKPEILRSSVVGSKTPVAFSVRA